MNPVDFIGRTAELETLERCHDSGLSHLIPIYGRRRVGKSRLILHFLQRKRGIYYVGKQAAAPMQLREFMQEAARACGRPGLASLQAHSWADALRAVSEEQHTDGPLVIALDEFQWMAAASPELPSVIQELWDRVWQPSGRVVLILCGSLIGFMERKLLGSKSPLFGRRTAQIVLRPFGYRQAAAFHPAYSLVDRARVHFICGGIPAYLCAFDARLSVLRNFELALLSETAPLYREPDFLLREELRELVSYFSIMNVLARRSVSARQLVQETGLKSSSLHYYLRTLAELGYVARVHPLTTTPLKKRDVRYTLDDPLLRFWFRFVEPNQTFIQQLGSRAALAERIKPELDSYFGLCFERLCRQALPALLQARGLRTAVEVGQFWSPETQIDLVGIRDDGEIEIGECKWGRAGSLRSLEQELAGKMDRYHNPHNRTLRGNIFVRKKTAAVERSRYQCWDLADIYGTAP